MSRLVPPNSLEHEASQTQTCQYRRVKDMEPGRTSGTGMCESSGECERDARRGFRQLRRNAGDAVDKDCLYCMQ